MIIFCILSRGTVLWHTLIDNLVVLLLNYHKYGTFGKFSFLFLFSFFFFFFFNFFYRKQYIGSFYSDIIGNLNHYAISRMC
jgi:hypothetical protein